MFKKTILSLVAIATLSTMASASDDYYVNYAQTFQHAQDFKVYGVQPFSELFSITNPRHSIEVGKVIIKSPDIQLGAEFGYIPEETQYDIMASIKIQKHDPVLYIFKPYFASKIGVGTKINKGDMINLSTSATAADYIVGYDTSSPATGYFDKDTMFFAIGYEIGTAIQLHKDLDLFVAYEFQHKQVQLSYRVVGKEELMNALSVGYNFSNLKLGLQYKF